ncbi:MAG: SatD family protein [Muribaculaceae bacterium]|nr:SatD family protein [Muribaculaceae bacterium]
MKLGAIITGDIIHSTQLTMEDRVYMIEQLEHLPQILNSVDKVVFEIFRGDSFQISITKASSALRCALATRAWLRSHRMGSTNQVLDARIALGVGTLDYQSHSLSTSDGEAYRLSGRALDNMTKSRLEVRTPWHDVNEELKLLTAFADDIVSSWSQNQSKIILMSLVENKSHVELSQELNISRQMVDKSLKASKEELIEAYIHRYEHLLNNHLQRQ